MSDHIFFDGAKFISAADAADVHSLSRDYVAKLCREGKVVGKRIGKNWYVNDLSLKEFLVAQEYQRSRRRESLAEERAREYQQLNDFGEVAEKPRIAQKAAQVPVHAFDLAKKAVAVRKAIRGDAAPGVQRAPILTPVVAHVHAMREKLSSTAAKHGQLVTQATRDLTHAGLPDAAMRSFAHMPVYSISPVGELAHKVVALALALMMTFGTYAALDPQYARFAAESARDHLRHVAASYEAFTGGGISHLADRAEAQVKVAVENPGASLAAVGSFFPERLANMAKALNANVDNFVYAVAFPSGLVERTDAGGASVAVEIAPYARATEPKLAVASEEPKEVASQSPTSATIVQQPVVERVIERVVPANAVAAAGGLTDEYLSDRLNQLENKLSAKMYSLASANSTAIVQTYNVTSQSNAIDHLGHVDIEDSTISRGTITNAAISGGSISGTRIEASSLTVSGVTSLTSLDLSGDITLGGSLNFSSSSSTISATLASTTNLLSINATTTNFVTTNSTTTGYAKFEGTLRISDSSAPTTGSLYFGNSTGRINYNSSDYTFYGGSVYTNAGRFVSIGNNETLGLGVRYVNGDGTYYLGASHSFTPDLIFTNTGLTERMRLTDAGLLTFEMASTTRLSVHGTAYFGGTATTTIDSAGNLAVAGTLGVTGDTTLTNATSTNFFATTASSTNLFAQTASFGSLALPNFSQNRIPYFGAAGAITSGSGLTYNGTTLTAGNFTSAGDVSLGNATSTNFFATTASSTNLYSQLATLGSTTVKSLTVGSGVSSGGLTVNGNGYFSGGLGIGVATTTAGVLQTSGNAWVGGNLHVVGNSTVLGASTADTLSINSSINSHLVPNQNISYNLGSPSYYWNNAYIGTLNANNISAANTQISGTQSADFTINSDNVSSDAEDANLIFFRGNVVPNAVIAWKSGAGAKRFELNQSTYISNQSGSTTQPTLRLQGVAGQTGNLFEAASSTGSTVFSVAYDGSVTISTSTITALTSGTSTMTNLSVTNTSTSTFAGPLTIGTNYLNITSTGQIVAGAATANASALFQLDSTTRGFLPPRLTTVQKNAISGPSSGLVVYDSSLNKLNVYNGTTWKNVGSTELDGEVTNGTANSVLFVDNGSSGPVLQQDNSNFSYASSTRTLSLANLSLTQGTSTAFFATTASSTNLFAQTASFGSLALPNFSQNRIPYFGAAGAITSGSGLTYNGTTLTAGNFTSAGDVSLGNATSTNFFATTASSTNLFAQTASLGSLTVTGNTTHTGTLTQTGLGTFTNGLLAQASSTVVGNFTSTGNGIFGGTLGVGTTTPGATLGVNGTAYLTGTASVSVPSLVIGGQNHLDLGNSSGGNMSWIAAGGVNNNLILRSQTNVGVSSSTLSIYPGAKFSVSGGIAVGSDFYTTSVTDGNMIVSGNVGVGSSSPFAKLSVKGAGSTTGINFQTTDSSNNSLFSILDNGGLTMLYGTSTTFFATTASSTNLFAQTASFGSLALPNFSQNRIPYFGAAGAITSGSGLTYDGTTLTAGNLTSAGDVSLGFATSTTFFATTASSTNLFAAAASFGSLALPNFAQNRVPYFGAAGAITSGSGLTYDGTTLTAGNLTSAGSVSLGFATSTTFFATTASSTSLFAQSAQVGSLGVGTSTPWAKLAVGATDNSATNQFVVASSSAVSLMVSKSGYVGIGTNSPTTPFYLNAATQASSVFAATGGTALNAGAVIIADGTTSGQATYGRLAIAPNTTYGTTELFFANGTPGVNSFVGFGSGIRHYGAPAGSADNAGLSLFTSYGTGSEQNVDRLSISYNGLVGIGTTSPNSLLEVSGSNTGTTLNAFQSGVTLSISNRSTTAGNFEALAFRTQDSTNGGATSSAQIVGVNTLHTASVSSGDLAFQTLNAGSLTEKLRITAAGDVGVGTSTPWAKLSVSTTDNSSSNQFLVASSSNVSLIINKSGFVGIGNSAPTATLDVTGTAKISSTLAVSGDATLANATSTNSFATTASSTNLFAQIASFGQVTVPALATAAGTFLAADPTGKLIATSSPGLSGTTGQIAYLSGTNTAVGTSTLFITTASNVGIGTTSPQAKLDIVKTSAGATADVLAISNLSSATSSAARLLFRTSDVANNTGTTTAAITSLLTQNFNGGKGDLVFSTLAAGALTEAMRLTSTGLLGIGTTTPTYKLSVANAASAPQFSLAYDSGHWTTQQVDASGNWTQTSTGGYNIFSNDNVEICANGSCPTTTATSTAGNLFVENAVVIGDGFSLREIDTSSLGLYNVSGGLMVTFDNTN